MVHEKGYDIRQALHGDPAVEKPEKIEFHHHEWEAVGCGLGDGRVD